MFGRKFYSILKVKDHDLNRGRILSEISKLNRPFPTINPSVNYDSYISNTDWDISFNPNWFEFSLSYADRIRFFNFIMKRYKSKKMILRGSWFNQYYPNSGSDHPFHEHNQHVVCIYYVELKDTSLRTVLINPKTNKEVIPKVNEGELLIFDGRVKHKSPRNYTNTRKTVLAYNFDLLE